MVKQSNQTAVSVMMPLTTAADIDRVADSLGLEHSRFYAVLLALGLREAARLVADGGTVSAALVEVESERGQ